MLSPTCYPLWSMWNRASITTQEVNCPQSPKQSTEMGLLLFPLPHLAREQTFKSTCRKGERRGSRGRKDEPWKVDPNISAENTFLKKRARTHWLSIHFSVHGEETSQHLTASLKQVVSVAHTSNLLQEASPPQGHHNKYPSSSQVGEGMKHTCL